MARTKIDWCDVVWNPAWGCRHACPYCYARAFARRFGKQKAYSEMKHLESLGWTLELVGCLAEALRAFRPTFLWSNFNRTFPRKPARIFVDSMSDIIFWKPDWMHLVLRRIRRHPEHTFLFLTKEPRAYTGLSFPPNCWLGASASTQEEVLRMQEELAGQERTFLSLEPIQEAIDPGTISPGAVEWLILGAETGNRKEKVLPELSWIRRLVFDSQVPVFMKRSLQDLWQMPMIQRFPAGMRGGSA